MYKFIFLFFYQFTWKRKSKIPLTLGNDLVITASSGRGHQPLNCLFLDGFFSCLHQVHVPTS